MTRKVVKSYGIKDTRERVVLLSLVSPVKEIIFYPCPSFPKYGKPVPTKLDVEKHIQSLQG